MANNQIGYLVFDLLISDSSFIGDPPVLESSNVGMSETGASAVAGAIRTQPEKLDQVKYSIYKIVSSEQL